MPFEFTLPLSALLFGPEADYRVALPSGFQRGLVRGSLVGDKRMGRELRAFISDGLSVGSPWAASGTLLKITAISRQLSL